MNPVGGLVRCGHMPWRNHFLKSLSNADLELIRPALEHVELRRDDLLAHAHEPLHLVYFPLDCILSVIVVMKDGREIESRTIGCESGYGLLNALGSRISYEQVICQIGGECCRMRGQALAEATQKSPSLLRAVVSHAQATILQAAQSTACNALHDVEGRLAKWLLMSQERVGGPVLPLTQEHFAIMLGVQRTTVTAIAQEFQEAGLISYSRGKIRLVDSPGLERRSCECFTAIQDGVAQMIGVGGQAATAS